MDIQVAKKWVMKRLASRDYTDFILADLFYKGKIPDCSFEEVSSSNFVLPDDTSSFITLRYNSLKRQIKKKVNYLLSRPYTVKGSDVVKEYIEQIIPILKDTTLELYKKGEVWWEFEPDSKSPIKFKLTIRKAQAVVPHYVNEEQTEYDAVGYLWNRIDESGEVYRYVDFVTSSGRYRFPLSKDNNEVPEELGHALKDGNKVTFKSLPFVRLTSEGLYQQIVSLGMMYSARYTQADTLLEDNADPVGIIKNASDTDAEILNQEIKENKLVKVEGTGDFSYASKSMDYSSIENFMKMLKSDIADICGTVSREQELSYVTSGRALDRLYVDMDADAADMGGVLREALKTFISFVSLETNKDLLKDFDIIFNTDKPTDETQIIQNIGSSRELLSEETLLEQHPWVTDVKKELARKKKEKKSQEQEQPAFGQESTPPDNTQEEQKEEEGTQKEEVGQE